MSVYHRIWAAAWWWTPVALMLVLLALQPSHELTSYEVRFDAISRCAEPLERLAERPRRVFRASRCLLLQSNLDASALKLDGAAVMLGGVVGDASIFLNGVMLREANRRIPHTYQSTIIVQTFSGAQLRPGANELLLEIHRGGTDSHVIGIARAFFGPRALISEWADRFLLLQQSGARLALILIGSVAVFLLPMMVGRPTVVRYRWYAIGLFGALSYIALFAVTWRPLSLQTLQVLGHLGLLLSVYAMTRFSMDLLGKPSSRWLNGVGLAAAAGMLLSSAPLLPWTLRMIGVGAYRLGCLGVLVYLLVQWWRGRGTALVPNGRWFTAACALLLMLGVSDSLKALQVNFAPAAMYLLHWGILYLVILMFVALIAELLQLLERSELNRDALTSALDLRTAELKVEFERRQQAEQAHTLAEERQRIMRDMHDGVGGQLVAMIGQLDQPIEADRVRQQLERTLDDLRLMIDSLDVACADLSVALGMLRARLERLLIGQPVRVVWRTAHLPDLPPVPPSTVLNVLRVIQESITNALKHACASSIEIAADFADGVLTLSVVDDGIGIAADARPGRGLASLHARAQAIGASLTIGQTAGTQVRLRLPLGAY
jgi:signal transduction histidine kinase